MAEDAGNYRLVGDHNGIIAIDRVTFTTSPAVADGQVARLHHDLLRTNRCPMTASR